MTKGGIKPGALFLPPTTSLHPLPFPSNSSLLNSWGPRLPSHLHQQQQSMGVRRLGRIEVQEEEWGECFGRDPDEAQKVLTSSEEEETTRAVSKLA